MFARRLFLVGSLIFVTAADAGPFFSRLGRLPTAPSENRFWSRAEGVSDDGQVVVGTGSSGSNLEGFRWTLSTGIVGLGDDPAGNFGSTARAVSGDGTVIVGGMTPNISSFQAGFRWTESTGLENLGYLDSSASFPFLSPAAVSTDGTLIAGTGRIGINNVGFIHSQANGFTTIGESANPPVDSVSDMSGDGRVVVGTTAGGPANNAFRWTEQDGIQLIDGLDGRRANFASAISTDGRVIAGSLAGPPSFSAFLWTEGIGIEDLGRFPVTNEFVRILDLNGDGSILVGEMGSSPTSFGGLDAVWWDRSHGFRLLGDVVTQDYGIDLGGWRLATARSISPDGRWIVGDAENSSGIREAFLIHIPETRSLILLAIVCSGGLLYRQCAGRHMASA